MRRGAAGWGTIDGNECGDGDQMAQKDVELILMRQLATYLAVPVILVDPRGELLFFNEPAEVLFGSSFDEADGLTRFEERVAALAFRNERGERVAREELPIIVAMRERRPVHRRLRIQGLDGVERFIEATGLPLEAAGGRLVGGVAMFWERPSP